MNSRHGRNGGTRIRLVVSLQNLFEQRSILVVELILEFVAHCVDRRELVAPLVGPGGVDDRSRIETFVFLGNSRIEGSAPAAANDVDVFRFRAGGDGPDDVIGIVDVDVIIYDNDVSAQISTGPALACDEGCLLGVTGIALIDFDDGEKAIASREEPDTFEDGHPGVLE